MSESEIQQLIMMEGHKYFNHLMRNNSGALNDATGRPVRYGLGNVSKKHTEMVKSSDLIGIKSILITPDMVGKVIGQFAAIEVKAEGWKRSPTDAREKAQQTFIDWVIARGGIAGFASNVNEYTKLIQTTYGI